MSVGCFEAFKGLQRDCVVVDDARGRNGDIVDSAGTYGGVVGRGDKGKLGFTECFEFDDVKRCVVRVVLFANKGLPFAVGKIDLQSLMLS